MEEKKSFLIFDIPNGDGLVIIEQGRVAKLYTRNFVNN